MKVRDLMSYPIVTVPPEAMVLDAIRVMAAQKKGSVLVAEECLLKECLGIVTTSQIFLGVFAKGQDPARVRVTDIMTPGPLITIDLDDSTQRAAELMQEHNISRLPEWKDGARGGTSPSQELPAGVG